MSTQPVTAWSHLEFDLADRLRRALRISHTSVQAMADELGVERNTVGRYINGHARPNRATLVVWAMTTGVPIEWLETGELDATLTGREQGTTWGATAVGAAAGDDGALGGVVVDLGAYRSGKRAGRFLSGPRVARRLA